MALMTTTAVLTIDFGGALLLMRSGLSVKRLAWERRRPIDRKYEIRLTADGRGIETVFLNYSSDRAVLSTEDLLAKDWVEVNR